MALAAREDHRVARVNFHVPRGTSEEERRRLPPVVGSRKALCEPAVRESLQWFWNRVPRVPAYMDMGERAELLANLSRLSFAAVSPPSAKATPK